MVDRKKSDRVHTGPLTEPQKKRLRGYVEEIERTEDEIDRLKLDVKGAYEALKGDCFDVAAVRKIIADRKKEPEQLEMFESTVDAYRAALSQPDKLPKSLMIDRPFAPPLDA